MNILSVEKLSKRYGVKLLFEDVSFGLEKGQKMALIARNGTGKTTLLRCLIGQEKPDTGTVTLRSGIRLGYLDQQIGMHSDRTLVDEVLDHDDPSSEAIRNYEHALARQDQKALQRAMERMDELQAWDHEARIKGLLHRLGLTDLEQPVNTLSGGQQKRVALAKVLSSDPDVLVLDEPTNHLDLDMIEWLEEELSAPQKTLLLVTHDRYFLDHVCDEIIELEDGKLNRYRGNYSYYVEKKALADEVNASTKERLQGMMRHELEWVRRMPKARSTKSKSRLHAFDDLKERATGRVREDKMTLAVKVNRLGGKVIEVRSLVKSFGDKKIVDKFDHSFKRGDRIGLVGPNGVGKSSFIELITGNLRPDAGKVVIGETVVLGKFDQNGLRIKEDKRVIEVVRDIADVIPLAKGQKLTASQLLERFLFDKDQQFAYVSTLSGGEKRRLHLCTVLMKNPNVLFLDEPTNDLDIPSLQALEEFLVDLDACILVVSHDRYFLDKVCGRLLEFQGNGKIKEFPGSYSVLRERNRERESVHRKTRDDPQKEERKKDRPAKITYAERLELKRLDKELAVLEKRKAELTTSLSEAGVDHTELLKRSKELERSIQQLEIIGERWLELSEKQENSA